MLKGATTCYENVINYGENKFKKNINQLLDINFMFQSIKRASTFQHVLHLFNVFFKVII